MIGCCNRRLTAVFSVIALAIIFAFPSIIMAVAPSAFLDINNDAASTSTDTVTLTVSPDKSNVSYMQFSNDGSNWSAQETVQPINYKTWKLSAGDGTKTVYVKFKSGNKWGDPYNDSIILDTTAPTGSIVINEGRIGTGSTAASLALSASDATDKDNNVTTVTEMQFSNDGTNWSSPESYSTAGTWTLSSGEGTKTVYVKFKDSAGNWSGALSDTIVLDTTAPATSASPAGGSYNSAKTVALSCDDGTGSGCKTTYYTVDGSTPDASSQIYSSPLAISANTVLRFFSIDNTGNAEPVKAQTYTFETDLPSVGITAPQSGLTLNDLTSVTGTASDPSSGVARVELQITNGTHYLNQSGWFVSEPLWINAEGTDKWSLNAGNVKWEDGASYAIRARAVDKSGNVSSHATVMFTKASQSGQAFTTLSLELSTQTILQNAGVDVAGKLTRLPVMPVDLSGIGVNLTVTAPDGTVTTHPATTYSTQGHYKFEKLSDFALKGTYVVKASFDGSATLASAESERKSVLVGASAGYAVIVQGKISNNEGLPSHNKTANRIYRKLRDRGFIDENIYYFNYDTSQEGVDAVPSKAGIQTAITGPLMEKINGSPAPLYVIMVNHGDKDIFHINNDIITAADLNSWLDTLENGLNANALAEKRIIVLGACYSGSFIPELSRSNRIIVTSAAADEESYKGPQEPDGVRSGEFFLDEFFRQLGYGYSFKASFETATEKTENFTRATSASANSPNKYFDYAVQHPLLDDNGDGAGSNVLSITDGDGKIAGSLFLGTGNNYDTNAATNPAEITAVTDTVYLDSATSSALLWATANSNDLVGSLWVEIRPPSKSLSFTGKSIQAEVSLEKVFLDLNDKNWAKTYAGFSEAGKYEVFYFVKDLSTGDISPMKRSVVYKNTSNNNPPSAFSLVSPEDGFKQKTVLVFDWGNSSDPDGDNITYSLVIATDAAFNNIFYKKEGVADSTTYVDMSAGLSDLTIYYWRVEAVDSFGAKTTSSQAWSFSTDNTNGYPGIVTGLVYGELDNMKINDASIDVGGVKAIVKNGMYIITTNAGTFTISAKDVQGYYKDAVLTGVDIKAGETTVVNLRMTSEGGAGMTADTIPPVTLASVSGGTYASARTVSLACDDGTDGSGCAAIYYSVDGNDPATAYSEAIAISSDMTLKFYSVDNEDNKETVNEETYKIVTLNSKTQAGLTVSKSGTGSGTVTSSPSGITCGVDCIETAGVFAKGKITLTATADADSTFTGWTGGGCKSAAKCIVTLSKETKVTANFVANPVLTVTKTGSGSGTIKGAPSASCETETGCAVYYNQKITLTATAAKGSIFTGWSGGVCKGTAKCSLTMGTDKEVTASFGKSDISVSPDSYAFGSLSTKAKPLSTTFVITNSGDADLKITKMAITSTVKGNAAMFKVTSKATATVKAGATFNVTVAFKATSAGDKNATLNITSNDTTNSPLSIALTGTGASATKAQTRGLDTTPCFPLNKGGIEGGCKGTVPGATTEIWFNPEGVITREEAGQIVNSLQSVVGLDTENSKGLSFMSDELTMQRPDDLLTRSEIVAISDQMSVNSQVATLNSQLFDGARLNAPITREELAVWLVIYELSADGEGAVPDCNDGSPFEDVATDWWSCGYIKRLHEMINN